MRKLAPNSVICGFKLLVDSTDGELISAMERQVKETEVDLVIGNDLRDIKADDHRLLVMKKDEFTGELVVRPYRQPPKAERTSKTANCLAKAVVDECVAVYERKKAQ
jgi:hypothetical protein